MNMAGYNKLVPEIVASSIWNETAETRIVWITLLATKDMNGYVRGDARTIGRLANVSTEEAQIALDLFQQPDPMSGTPDNEGRRIAPAPGGWKVLNHDLYRERGMSEDKKLEWREKKREQRERAKELKDNALSVVQEMSKTVGGQDVSVSASVSVLNKKAYGEFQNVMLTDEEHSKLLAKHGKERTATGIEMLGAWLESSGKRKKKHYACLNATSWVWQKLDEQGGKGATPNRWVSNQ